MRTETFSFDIEYHWQDKASDVFLVIDKLYYAEKDIITVHVFLNQTDATSDTAIVDNSNFAFRFVIQPHPRYEESINKGLLPWAVPGTTEVDPPLSFEQSIKRYLQKLKVEGGRLDVTLVPFDPEDLLESEALEINGGVSLRFART